MARSAAPKSNAPASQSVPEKIKNDKGLVTNWSLAWPESIELERIVQHGTVDGMTPKQVMELYPVQFQQFAYRPFASALNNARRRHKKHIADRENHQNPAPTAGVQALASELSDLQNNGNMKTTATAVEQGAVGDHDVDGISVAVSHMTVDDDATAFNSCKNGVSGSASGISLSSQTRINTMNNARNVHFTSGDGGTSKCKVVAPPVGLSYVQDLWRDGQCRKRCSFEFHCPSGLKPSGRPGSDKQSFIVRIPLPECMMTPEASFDWLFHRQDTASDLTGVSRELLIKQLEVHPKVIARRSAIAKLQQRNPDSTEIVFTQRIPIPFVVSHRLVTEADDSLFNGQKFITQPDGSVFWHVELIQEQNDSYSSPCQAPGFGSYRSGNVNIQSARTPSSQCAPATSASFQFHNGSTPVRSGAGGNQASPSPGSAYGSDGSSYTDSMVGSTISFNSNRDMDTASTSSNATSHHSYAKSHRSRSGKISCKSRSSKSGRSHDHHSSSRRSSHSADSTTDEWEKNNPDNESDSNQRYCESGHQSDPILIDASIAGNRSHRSSHSNRSALEAIAETVNSHDSSDDPFLQQESAAPASFQSPHCHNSPSVRSSNSKRSYSQSSGKKSVKSSKSLPIQNLKSPPPAQESSTASLPASFSVPLAIETRDNFYDDAPPAAISPGALTNASTISSYPATVDERPTRRSPRNHNGAYGRKKYDEHFPKYSRVG